MGRGDLSQIELRVGFSLANELAGIAAYQRGDDLHTETARMLIELAQKDWEQMSPAERKVMRTHAKATNFALLYGGSYKTLQDYARRAYGVEFTDEQAQEIVRWYFGKKYTRLNVWHSNTLMDFRMKQGRIESVLGFAWQYDAWDHPNDEKRSHAERSALNNTVQGPAAQICLLIGILVGNRLVDEGADSRFIGTTHDSLEFEMPPGEEEALMALFEEAVASTYDWIKPWFQVPLVMEFEKGERLGSLEEFAKVSAGLQKAA